MASEPRAVHFRFRFGPSQRRAWLRVGLVLLWAVLVVWLIQVLFSGGGDPVSVPDGGTPPARTEQGTAAPAAGVSPGVEAPAYGVLAITYLGDSQAQTAKRIGGILQKELQYPDVQLHRTEERGKVFYELFVGRAPDSAALAPLLDKVRKQSLPGETRKPFESAYVRQLPSIEP
ncbi:MAG: hypothetical protein O3A20_11500 [Planctomycetota bacterium]|nr:hypothetical protein [Planctomycetota bacterium]